MDLFEAPVAARVRGGLGKAEDLAGNGSGELFVAAEQAEPLVAGPITGLALLDHPLRAVEALWQLPQGVIPRPLSARSRPAMRSHHNDAPCRMGAPVPPVTGGSVHFRTRIQITPDVRCQPRVAGVSAGGNCDFFGFRSSELRLCEKLQRVSSFSHVGQIA
jgi:hypothetical protein